MKEEYAEIIELLEPVLYALPDVAETIRKKSAEFGNKRQNGVAYSREELVEVGMKSLSELMEYFVDQAGKKGLLGKLVAKRAGDYLTRSVTDMLLGNET
ncbi:MAG TPA: hypothetical protein VJJ76_02425 [archaeon]|uniref:Uncharacterized protein n=1 Tax=Candidatus Wolfebacteria bacterium RIFCSPLOWO2_01_FULL_47_17b TaxID=1802558 RepID=A0A1F8E057_9BACT|nr:MAG: hypothetical protein A2935_03730 [Candidatus Wolfebacteria bacterium RIFCSPLOWO2_01_FULL_47_17b]HLC39714.1 hypothetical protein [archaeon]